MRSEIGLSSHFLIVNAWPIKPSILRVLSFRWSMITIWASFKCKLAFCFSALISNHNDWQCFRRSLRFGPSLYRNEVNVILFFFEGEALINRSDAAWSMCVCARTPVSKLTYIFLFTVRYAHMLRRLLWCALLLLSQYFRNVYTRISIVSQVIWIFDAWIDDFLRERFWAVCLDGQIWWHLNYMISNAISHPKSSQNQKKAT